MSSIEEEDPQPKNPENRRSDNTGNKKGKELKAQEEQQMNVNRGPST